jgi:hypothetical protein
VLCIKVKLGTRISVMVSNFAAQDLGQNDWEYFFLILHASLNMVSQQNNLIDRVPLFKELKSSKFRATSIRIGFQQKECRKELAMQHLIGSTSSLRVSQVQAAGRARNTGNAD